jgi:hypothetical protein
MGRRVELELPDEVLDRAERLAVMTHREVAEVLAAAVSVALPPVEVGSEKDTHLTSLSDAAVLQLAGHRLSPLQDRRLSELLDRQQSGTLTDAERIDLLSLIQHYEASWLLQVDALAEAVRRGLREPLSP